MQKYNIYFISTALKSTNSPFLRLRSTSILKSLRLRSPSIKRRKKMFGIATPRAMQTIASEALMALFMPTVTSPTTPCISMKAKRARYISTPGTIGMTLGMVMH